MKTRTDIQVLRGWAVALVVMDHARLGPFHGGFLGVDIFFVISGFLITAIIVRDLDAGEFSFREFYLKRARRILPAVYATMFLTSIGAIWFMTSTEFNDLKSQILGGVTFTINFVLMGQTDYFASGAETKPLLHLWSLAIEEQFYLLFPAVLVFSPKRWRRLVVVALAVTSLVACAVLLWRGALTEAFFLLPTRAWELLAGSIIAIFATELSRYPRVWSILLLPALAGLIAIPLVRFGDHPGFQAVAVCLCTAIVILANAPWVGSLDPLRRLGDVSYSLYLVHWPIAVFAFQSYYGDPTLALKLTVIGLSVVFAVLIYVLIERPARVYFTRANWKAVAASVLGAAAVLGSYPIAKAASPNIAEFALARRPNHGLGSKCIYRREPFSPKPECATSETPDILVWGDSFAMHLIDGLVAAGLRLRQATLSACAPVLGQASHVPGRYDERWARDCIAFNDDVLKHIEEHPYRVVLIAGSWTTIEGQRAFLRNENGELEDSKTSLDRSLSSLRTAVERIRASGKTVIFTEPPPNAGMDFNVGTCAERMLSGKFLFGPRSDCRFDRLEYEARARNLVEFVSRSGRELDLPILHISAAICDAMICNGVIDGTAIFRDRSHLSKNGSKLVMQRVGLPELLEAETRTSSR